MKIAYMCLQFKYNLSAQLEDNASTQWLGKGVFKGVVFNAFSDKQILNYCCNLDSVV